MRYLGVGSPGRNRRGPPLCALALLTLGACGGSTDSGDNGESEGEVHAAQQAVVAQTQCVSIVRTTTSGAAFDALLHSGNPGTNYGAIPTLQAGPGTNLESLLRFDLSTLPSLPVASATLR